MEELLKIQTGETFELKSWKNKPTASKNNLNGKFSAKTEVGNVNDYLKQFENPSQKFKVSAYRPSKVNGRQGTIISINPADLETEDGRPMGTDIEVELKELTNQQQLLNSRTQTISNGKLLVSGGAYYINLTSDQKQLRLKKEKSLSAEFPKLVNDEMSLFYGQRNSTEQINWLQAAQKFESRRSDLEAIPGYMRPEENEPFTKEGENTIEEQEKNAELADELYKAIELKQFGWINCDRFYNVPYKTNLLYTFSDPDDVVKANVYLVFKDINSIMQDHYFPPGNKRINNGSQNIMRDNNFFFVNRRIDNDIRNIMQDNYFPFVNRRINNGIRNIMRNPYFSIYGTGINNGFLNSMRNRYLSFYDGGTNTGFRNIPVGAKTQLIAVSIRNGKPYIYKSDLTIEENKTIQLTLTETSREQVRKLFQAC